MDTKKFIDALRKVIREEVQTAVRTEVKKLLSENKVNHKKTIDHGLQLERMTKQRETRNYSKDPLLNDLLNETAAVPTESWPTVDFRSEMAHAFGGMRQMMDTGIPHVAPQTDHDGRPVNMSNEHVASAVTAMTKDYSALMKAIDKKKGVK